MSKSVKADSSDQTQDKLSQLEQENSELRDTNSKLQEELFAHKEMLHEMQSARLLGRVIKTRDSIGDPKTFPIRSLKKARKSIGKRTPDIIRIPVGRVIRIAQGTAKTAKSVLDRVLIKVVTVENVPWIEAPLVSVVIPYYNRHDTIDDTLKSLSVQTFNNFEVILVNDGSSDEESIVKLKDLRKSSPVDLKIIDQKNQGVAIARNHGIEQAKGKYIICLDSDDMLDSTYIEKSLVVAETQPDISLTTTYMNMFGVRSEEFKHAKYDALDLYRNNMVITAAMFRRDAWKKVGGYRSKIGYEDWEFWINLAENGFFGRQIPESLFRYRTALQSRYIDDKEKHWNNVRAIRDIHPTYRRIVRRINRLRQYRKSTTTPETALLNMADISNYRTEDSLRPNVLLAIPCMTFGGAETLLYNFCRQTKNAYNVSFITGLQSDNQWEYKFKEISDRIYHLPNIFDDKNLYVEFISNYIATRNIHILHIVHTDFVFHLLPEIKKRHPHLKVIVTMFNDRVISYVAGVIEYQQYIDVVSSDNEKTAKSFIRKLNKDARLKVIPNGIDSEHEFSQELFNRESQRKELGLDSDDMAVFFVGRLSSEKNPDVFIRAAKKLLKQPGTDKIKFYVIGDGPMRPAVDRLLYGVDEGRIRYLGYQSEVARFLSAADVFVLPSSIEGFPLSILEAMAMRVVVVASNVGAIPDVIQQGRNGYIIEPGSVDDIVKVVSELSIDRHTLEKVKQAGRIDVDTLYSHKQLGKNYKVLYKDTLK